jgi:hypothetical protein
LAAGEEREEVRGDACGRTGAGELQTAADLYRPIRLGGPARALLAEGQKPVAYLRLLAKNATRMTP